MTGGLFYTILTILFCALFGAVWLLLKAIGEYFDKNGSANKIK